MPGDSDRFSRMTAAEFKAQGGFAGSDTRSRKKRVVPQRDRMSAAEVREAQTLIQNEEAVEATCVEYLVLQGWQTTHHEPFEQAGPPLKLNVAQVDRLRGEGAKALRYAGFVPTYLPVKPVVEGSKAWPDRICVHPRSGRCVLIEFKKPGQKPRPDQQAFLDSNPETSFWCDGLDTMIAELRKRRLPGG